MSILFSERTQTFHLCNEQISYIMTVLPNRQMGQLYFGKRIHHKEDFSYLLEACSRPMTSCVFEDNRTFSLEHTKQEYGVYGTTDYRRPAVEVLQENGSRLSDFQYQGYEIIPGKPKLEGLPATYTESEDEAETLVLILKDSVTGVTLRLLYTLFAQDGILARSAQFVNEGKQSVHLTAAMSLCMDLPDCNYEWMQFSGAWARERHLITRKLEPGIVSVDSRRGNSSHNHNPFVILKRPDTNEYQGEAIGFSLVYSGNFLAQAETDTHETTRVLLGIHPMGFDWKLEPGESFQTPEAVMAYTAHGLNSLSQAYHRLYQKRLARGYWRDRERPVLNNNWEATYFNFTEDRLVQIASKAKECGVELFVLDDGWFGQRSSDNAGLGDWTANPERLPNGITGLAQRIEDLGMKFGLWFEPEMVSEDSDLYRNHPDWAVGVPGRKPCLSRGQLILDFSRKDVQDYIIEQIFDLLDGIPVTYVKWDCNRAICDKFSRMLDSSRQGEFSHRYVLGLYRVLEELTERFPKILFESCSGGGGRFDAGMLFYTPQIWASDTTDAIERLSIQYGASFGYPVSVMGTHVSMVPNHQTGRVTPLSTKGCMAMAGTFGYELDIDKLTQEEKAEIKEQTDVFKKHYDLIQHGDYYRISSPLEGTCTVWEIADPSGGEALVSAVYHHVQANPVPVRVKVQGLKDEADYQLYLNENFEEKYPGKRLPHGFASGEVISGASLRQFGFVVPEAMNGFQAWQIYIKECSCSCE